MRRAGGAFLLAVFWHFLRHPWTLSANKISSAVIAKSSPRKMTSKRNVMSQLQHCKSALLRKDKLFDLHLFFSSWRGPSLEIKSSCFPSVASLTFAMVCPGLVVFLVCLLRFPVHVGRICRLPVPISFLTVDVMPFAVPLSAALSSMWGLFPWTLPTDSAWPPNKLFFSSLENFFTSCFWAWAHITTTIHPLTCPALDLLLQATGLALSCLSPVELALIGFQTLLLPPRSASHPQPCLSWQEGRIVSQ